MNLPTFVEEASYEKGFAAHYNQKIRPLLEELENDRLAILKRVYPAIAIGVLLIITLFVGPVIVFFINPELIFTIGIPIGGGLFILIAATILSTVYFITSYGKRVKAKIIPIICDFFGGLNYKPNEPINEDLIETEIFPRNHLKSTHDLIEGIADGIHFKTFGLDIVKGGKAHKVLFAGMVIVIDFPKKFTGKTIVKRDCGGALNWLEKPAGFKDVDLEDPRFEKEFEVYADDQVEARYLLTAAFMERIIKLSELTKESSVQCEFVNKELIIGVNFRANDEENSQVGFLEVGSIRKSVMETEYIHVFLKQIHEIFTLIAALKIKK